MNSSGGAGGSNNNNNAGPNGGDDNDYQGGGGNNYDIGAPVGGDNNNDHQEANGGDLLQGFNELAAFNQEFVQDFGAEEAVVPANDGGGGGVNFQLFEGHETEYLLSLIQDSVILGPPETHALLTRRDMTILTVAPNRPQPPAMFMLHGPVVLGGLVDGYTWRITNQYHDKVDGVIAIDVLRCENTREFNRTMVRKICCLTGQRDLFTVHYYLVA